MLNRRSFRFGLLAAGLCAIGINLWLAVAKRSQTVRPVLATHQKAQPIPVGGAVVTPNTHGQVPGNPERTVADMKRLFQALQIYAKRHDGAYPQPGVSASLTEDAVHNPASYGYENPMIAIKAFRNPDMKYSDRAGNSPQPETYFPYIIKRSRPDGTTVDSPKPSGTRDVLAYTDIYFHENLRTFPDGKSTRKPVGFFLVLWDDGEVQKVPFQDVRFAAPKAAANGSIPETIVFPGQAGAPPQGTISRAEYEKWVNDHI